MRNLVVVACLAGCAPHAEPVAPASFLELPTPEISAQHTDAIRAAAADFTKWGRVDERLNIAPGKCNPPLPEDYGEPSHLRRSVPERGPHGRKLYYLWANDSRSYKDAKAELSVGFAIVKESFAAVPVDSAHPPRDPHGGRSPSGPYDGSFVPHAIAWVTTFWGEKLTTGEPTGLFVMIKLDHSRATDAGWIYGTIAPDGTVTSAGRVATCMSCHVRYARRERLFGLPPAGQ